jgi:asparagine synthase (glutamine-hydrolysing)
MCGIAGFCGNDQNLLARMMESIHHRGPDESGYFIDDTVSLGHRRLKIIDLESGRQPVYNEDESVVVIFNGEIYNHRTLRQDLEKKGHRFYTNTDTEVIVHAYEEEGIACVRKFNGMFAFAIYDSNKKCIHLARDRIGVKPLYYYSEGKKFLFASEIKALLEDPTLPREINAGAFHDYIKFRFVPGEQTLIAGIRKLLPGHILTWKSGGHSSSQYWDIREHQMGGSEEEHVETLRRLLGDAVLSRLESDVPLGVFLCGGIDSAAIVALMHEHTDSIKTFSVGFEAQEDTELPYARVVAEEFNTDHHECFVTDKHLALIPKMVWHLDEPVGDAATLPTMALSQYAKQYVTVVLAGEGGDEAFAGYDNQRIMMQCIRFNSQYLPLKRIIARIGRYTSPGCNLHRVLATLSSQSLEQQYATLTSLFTSDELKQMGIANEPSNLSRYYPGEPMNPLNKIQYFGLKTWLPHDFCMKADKMTMAYGIEERAPLLDYRLMEFAFSLPAHEKIQGRTGKYILKKAMEPQLPRSIVYRKKHGYNAPMDQWFKGELKDVLRSLVDEREHSLYDTGYVEKLLSDFQRSGSNYKMNFWNAQKLWSLLVFEMWYRIFIQRIGYKSIRM